MDMIEIEFLEQQEIKPWVWLRYIDDIFFVWLEGEHKLLDFMKKFNEFHSRNTYRNYLLGLIIGHSLWWLIEKI